MLCCVVLCCVGLDWIGLDWILLDYLRREPREATPFPLPSERRLVGEAPVQNYVVIHIIIYCNAHYNILYKGFAHKPAHG